MVLLLTLLVVTTVMSALVGHALSRGWLNPNGFVGLRTPRTLRDRAAWMLTHAAFGRVRQWHQHDWLRPSLRPQQHVRVPERRGRRRLLLGDERLAAQVVLDGVGLGLGRDIEPV